MRNQVGLLLIVLWIASNSAWAGNPLSESVTLTIEQAVQMALERNRTILNAVAALESQKLSLNAAESDFDVKILPSASTELNDEDKTAGAGVSFQKKFDIGAKTSITPRVRMADSAYTGDVTLSLELPLFRGFGKTINMDAKEQASFAVRNAQRALYQTRIGIILDTVSAVYEIIRSQEMVKLHASLAEQLAGHVRIARIKENIGLATPLDTYRAQIRLKDVESSLNLARESLRSSEDRLKLILSMPIESPITVSAPVEVEPVSIELNAAIETALMNRIELEQLTDELHESQRRSEIARHNMLAQLNLAMNYDRFGTSDSFGNRMNFNEDRWSIELTGSTDLARTYEKMAFQQSTIQIQTVQSRIEIESEEIKKQVRQQIEFLNKSNERLTIKAEQKKQAQGKLSLAKIKFTHGMADNFDVIEAEKELQQANIDLLSITSEYIIGSYKMRAIMGTLLER